MNSDRIYNTAKEIERHQWNPSSITELVEGFKALKDQEENDDYLIILDDLTERALINYTEHMKYVGKLIREKLIIGDESQEQIVIWALAKVTDLTSSLSGLECTETIRELKNKCLSDFRIYI